MEKLSLYWSAEHDENPVLVATPDELTRAVESVRTAVEPGDVVLVQAVPAEDVWSAELLVGFDGDKGVVLYTSATSGGLKYSRNKVPSNPEPVLYYLVTADEEFPPHSEVPISEVVAALTDFMEDSGAMPKSVDWQP